MNLGIEHNGTPDPDWADNILEDPDVIRYMDRLMQRLPNYARRAALLGKEKVDSIEQLGRMGKFWWQQREIRHMSRRDVAGGLAETPEGIDVMVDNVVFFEIGLADPPTYRGDFPERYAKVLSDPALYKQYCEKFDIPFRVPQEPNEPPTPK